MKLKKIGWYKKSSIISITLLHTKGIMKTITLKTQEMTKRMQRDSLRAKGVDDKLLKDFDSTLMDGLEEEPLKGWVSDELIEKALLKIKKVV